MAEHGKVMAFAESDSSLPSRWYPQLGEAVTAPTMLVPFRHSDRGWFDYNPMLASVPMALWHHGSDPAGRRRLAELRERAGYDWRIVRSFRNKEEAGHEEPWFAFLTGDNPDYPEKILAAAQAQVRHRLARMRAHRDVDVPEADIHLWQQCNPVVTEALVQLTWGGPQVIYNGGCSRPGSATTTPIGGVRACPPRWRPWSRTSTRGPRSSTWSTCTRIRLTLTLALRTRTPSYVTPFDGDLLARSWQSPGGRPPVEGGWPPGPFMSQLGRCHCWLLPPLQVHRTSWVPLAVLDPGSSRHLPEAGLTRVPLLACHCWFPPPLQSHSSIRVPLP